MKKYLLLEFFLCANVALLAQSRLFVSSGMAISNGSGFNILFATERTHAMVELEWDKKMVGSFHSIVGLSYFRTGYYAEESAFGSMSRFRGNYLAVPLLARYNIGNKNYMYIDAGFNPYVLLKANLEEGVTQFGQFRTAEADITRYSNRLFMAYRVQFTVAVNRFSISEFIVWQGKGNGSVKDLQEHWAFNQEKSTYLQSDGFSDFLLFGVKLGIRIL